MPEDIPTIVLPTAIDESGARAQLAAFTAQIGGNPARGAFGGAAGPGVGGTFAGAAIGPPVVGGTGLGAGNTVGSVQAAGGQVAQALQSVAQQIRGSGAGLASNSAGIRFNPAAPNAWQFLHPGGWAAINAQAAGGGGGIGGPPALGGGGLAPAAGPGVPGGGGGWTQGNLNQLAAAYGGMGGGGGGRGNPSRSYAFGAGLSRLRGLVYGVGASEVASAYRGSAINDARSAYAGSAEDAYEASLATVDRATSGPFGTIIGVGVDAADWVGQKTGLYNYAGPTRLRADEIRARATRAAQDRLRNALLEGRRGDRERAGGVGEYGRQASGIESRYDAVRERIAGERQDVNSIEDAETRAIRTRELNERDREAGLDRAFRLQNLNRDVGNETANYRDEAAVARGRLTRGAAGRRALERRFQGQNTPEDRARNVAELGAYDANEGYRVWQREYEARGERDEAQFRLNRQPNVARANEIFRSGVERFEDARRSGTRQEAEYIRQTTRTSLLDLQRSLLESGSAVFSENADVSLPSDRGKTGLTSTREGDDIAQVLAFMPQLLRQLEDIKNSLN